MRELALLIGNPAGVNSLSPAKAAQVLAELATLQAALVQHLQQQPPPRPSAPTPPDRLLEPQEAAARLGVTVRWLYRHADQLPFTVRLGRKAMRFSELGLARFIAERGR